uniref:Uncharacterized protein n=1 Tax=Globodera rostochiensis TaxID=31243 RepID=A0A914H9I7_GLORO
MSCQEYYGPTRAFPTCENVRPTSSPKRVSAPPKSRRFRRWALAQKCVARQRDAFPFDFGHLFIGPVNDSFGQGTAGQRSVRCDASIGGGNVAQKELSVETGPRRTIWRNRAKRKTKLKALMEDVNLKQKQPQQDPKGKIGWLNKDQGQCEELMRLKAAQAMAVAGQQNMEQTAYAEQQKADQKALKATIAQQFNERDEKLNNFLRQFIEEQNKNQKKMAELANNSKKELEKGMNQLTKGRCNYKSQDSSHCLPFAQNCCG